MSNDSEVVGYCLKGNEQVIKSTLNEVVEDYLCVLEDGSEIPDTIDIESVVYREFADRFKENVAIRVLEITEDCLSNFLDTESYPDYTPAMRIMAKALLELCLDEWKEHLLDTGEVITVDMKDWMNKNLTLRRELRF